MPSSRKKIASPGHHKRINIPASNSDYAFFIVMFILPVTTFNSYHEPPILFNNFYDPLSFHFNRPKTDCFIFRLFDKDGKFIKLFIR